MEKSILETIKEALENNQLEQKLSVIKMEAVKQNITEDELNNMVKQAKQPVEAQRQRTEAQERERKIQEKAVASAVKSKYILWGICAALVILEWILIFNAHPAEGEKSHLILTLIVNIITLLAVVIGAAAFFRNRR